MARLATLVNPLSVPTFFKALNVERLIESMSSDQGMPWFELSKMSQEMVPLGALLSGIFKESNGIYLFQMSL